MTMLGIQDQYPGLIQTRIVGFPQSVKEISANIKKPTKYQSRFNNKMQKLHVAFDDGTDDYISTEDIDEVEISLI